MDCTENDRECLVRRGQTKESERQIVADDELDILKEALGSRSSPTAIHLMLVGNLQTTYLAFF